MAEEEFTDESSGATDEATIPTWPDVAVDTADQVDTNQADMETVREEMQAEIDRLTQRAQLLDEFEANPQAVLSNVAERLGMDLVPKQSAGASSQGTSNTQPPPTFVDNVTRNLPPEMQFMGDSIAAATWIANQDALRPFQQQQLESAQRANLQERDRIAAEMDASHPEWRKSIGDMEERYTFIREAVNGGSMQHPKFGSLQEMLYGLATGEKSAVTTAASRMRDASRNATSTSSNQSPSPVSVQKQIREAKTPDDKFTIAFQAALAEHGVST